jgi:ribosomal protein S18 acetylase RimI-like enzyme
MIIRKCALDDLSQLQKVSHETYREAFYGMCREADMNAYLKKAFCIDQLKDELLNDGCSFYFLYDNSSLAGYLKLNEGAAQTDIKDLNSLELERIYVVNQYQGRGLGAFLLEWAEKEGYYRKKSYLWLGVWEKNKKALAFYQKHGFYQKGNHSFVMGDDVQKDLLLRKDL